VIKSYIYVLLLLSLLSLTSAAHTITVSTGGTSFSLNEDVQNMYNISVQNTDTLNTSNITQVNITIPSTFTFITATNATDATASTFTNTSKILSWANDGLVMNLTTQYFWFNTTASTPGDYNITVTTTSATGSYSTNLSVEVNDTTAPAITLVEPVNATSATTTAYNFTFNVSDDSTVSNCSLYIGGAVYNTLATVSTTTTNRMYNSSFAAGTYIWSVSCTDAAGSTGNSTNNTLTVTAAATLNTSSSSATSTFGVSAEKLSQGYKKRLYKNYKLRFPLDSEYHILKMLSITDDQIEISVESSLQEATLTVGEEKKFDLNSDNVYDVSVKLDLIGVIEGRPNFADIIISSISEEMTTEEPTEEVKDVKEDSQASAENEEGNNLIWLWTIIIIVAIFIIIISYKKYKAPIHKPYTPLF